MKADADRIVVEILHQYGILHPEITPVTTGLINHTWLITNRESRYTLQRINPMFSAEIHLDIATVTTHLNDQGILTPQLVKTTESQLYVQQNEQLWRLYNYIEGKTYDTVEQPALAYQAGLILARFHQGMLNLDYQFKNNRTGVHDTQKHIQILRTALQEKQGHSRFNDILPLAQEILILAGQLPELPGLIPRKVHGDPKINNFLFEAGTGKGLCLLDFDTLGYMSLPLEIGDAMRSWCNPAGENNQQTFFSLDNFRAGLQGYAEIASNFIGEEEWKSIIAATRIIYIELAARFCADALNETFFSWDQSRFNSHSEHNQVRATSQLNAFKSLNAQHKEAEGILTDIFVDIH